MKYPSITVLITIKNAKDTIKQCIDSLLKLDYPNYRIFVVDAFSNDGTYEILKSYGNKIELHQLKGWAPRAYNWAIDRIKTEYIALIDGDCTVPRNWLKELIKGFKSDDILEVLGFCATPKNVSKLQKIIGADLEDRFKHLPKYPSRAPTMNVIFKTETAKKLKFDESLRVGYDTDFSFRLTKLGKIYYNPKAVIYHYHRATWKNYFKQQYITATMMPKLYSKHKSKSKGDPITKSTMIIQPFLSYLGILGLILYFLTSQFLAFAISMFLILLFLFIVDTIRLSKNLSDVFWLFAIFIVRNVAWSIGLIKGIISYLIGR
ncbi:MAG: glycosyltransferase [Candidatus Aenigmatarchaeota archaeon]